LLFVQLALLHGASEVVAVDVAPTRRDMAKRFGAAFALSPDELSAEGSDGAADDFSLVIEASGNPQAVAQGLRRVRAGGRFLQFGVCPPTATTVMAPFAIYRHEITIVGSFSLNRELAAAIALLRSGRVDVNSLTTHRLALDGYGAALQLMRDGSALKVQLVPHDSQ
jgi:threonine dehydrogenase-like Zn-dependent dehydrogenase